MRHRNHPRYGLVVGPVTDTDDALAAELQLLAAMKKSTGTTPGMTVKVDVALPKVEGIAHVTGNHVGRQAKGIARR